MTAVTFATLKKKTACNNNNNIHIIYIARFFSKSGKVTAVTCHLCHQFLVPPPEIRKKNIWVLDIWNLLRYLQPKPHHKSIKTYGKARNYPYGSACNSHLQRWQHPNLPEAHPSDEAIRRTSRSGSLRVKSLAFPPFGGRCISCFAP